MRMNFEDQLDPIAPKLIGSIYYPPGNFKVLSILGRLTDWNYSVEHVPLPAEKMRVLAIYIRPRDYPSGKVCCQSVNDACDLWH